MRRVIVAMAVLLVISGGYARLAIAEDRLGDTTLVDETFRMAPGTDLRQCITVAQMAQLTVIASSPEGRTGETAALNFSDNRQTVSPNVQLLLMQVPSEQVVSSHLAPAGSYCYYVSVSHNLTSVLPDDAAEKPYKLVSLHIVSTPYTP